MEKRAGLIITGGVLLGNLLSEGRFSRTVIDPGYQNASKRRSEILCFPDARLHRDSEMQQ